MLASLVFTQALHPNPNHNPDSNCDLYTVPRLTTRALQVPRSDKLLAGVAMAARNGLGSDAWMPQPSGNVYLHRWAGVVGAGVA